MGPRVLIFLFISISFVLACSSGGEGDGSTDAERDGSTDAERAGSTDSEITYSCRYDNKFAGPDCKEYIGPKWADLSVVEENCGSSFVEENAEVVQEACPEFVEVDGEKKPARGVCHVDKGGEEEYDLYSYDAPLHISESACEVYMDGEWESFMSEDEGVDVHEALPEAFDALDSTDKVTVSSQCRNDECLALMIENGETFDFTPIGEGPEAGFVFYPGGNVDPRAYAPSAMAIAEQGIFVSIVPMEDYLALNGYMNADHVRAANPGIAKWFVGGHSLGGAMTARYGNTDTGKTVDGLIIWASVAGDEYSLSDSLLPILSIYGELDGGNSPEQVKSYAYTLPEDAVYICVDGGDHSQFGYYEDENSPATVSREIQQAKIVEATVAFIDDPAGISSVECSD